jgi:hypothetical protein
MMCNPNPNPNDMTPTGSKPTGSPTGKQPLNMSQWAEAFEKFRLDTLTTVTQRREKWLKQVLIDSGLPKNFVDCVEARDPACMDFVQRWCKIRGFAFSTRELNTIQLLQHGKIIRDETLFKMPVHRYADASTCS